MASLFSSDKFWNYDMLSAPHNKPVIVWDDYWLMRIAVWCHKSDSFVVDQPCAEEPKAEEGKGLHLNPVCWTSSPPLPLFRGF